MRPYYDLSVVGGRLGHTPGDSNRKAAAANWWVLILAMLWSLFAHGSGFKVLDNIDQEVLLVVD